MFFITLFFLRNVYDDIKEKSLEFIRIDEAIYYSISKHYKKWIIVKIIMVPILGIIMSPFILFWFKRRSKKQTQQTAITQKNPSGGPLPV